MGILARIRFLHYGQRNWVDDDFITLQSFISLQISPYRGLVELAQSLIYN